jgi:ubiquinone/menaquinone biosynthesis C-methylase UbiE
VPGWLTPGRQRGAEILDDPATPEDVRAAAMADVERSNGLFGGARAVERVVVPLLREGRGGLLLDIGTGRGDIPERIVRRMRRERIEVAAIGLDRSEAAARTARAGMAGVANALDLPIRSRSVDVVVCSQVLHHFFDEEMRRVVAELHRVSRGWVVIADLRRGLVPAVGFWLASFVFRFHWATRLDGVTSVMRGFTTAELETLVRSVTGTTPVVRRGLFWRVTAAWKVA